MPKLSTLISLDAQDALRTANQPDASNPFATQLDLEDLAGVDLTNNPPTQVQVGTALVGTGQAAARSDHAHSVSTAQAGASTPGDSAAVGTATSLARSDHRHSLPAFGSTAGTFCQGNDARLSNPRTPTAHATTHQDGGADELSVEGLSGSLADPQLANRLATSTTPVAISSTAPTAGQVLQATSTTAASWQTPPSTSTPTAHATSHQDGGTDELNLTGLSGRLQDPQLADAIKTTAAQVTIAPTAPSANQVLTASSATAASWQTPASGISLTNAAPVNVTKATAAVGIGTAAARSDHKHDISTAAPVSLDLGLGLDDQTDPGFNGTNAEGTATSLARSDHKHAHGEVVIPMGEGGSLYLPHWPVDSTRFGLMAPEDYQYLQQLHDNGGGVSAATVSHLIGQGTIRFSKANVAATTASTAINIDQTTDHDVQLYQNSTLVFTGSNTFSYWARGTIVVTQMNAGGFTLGFTPPAGYTLLQDPGVASLNPASTGATVYQYWLLATTPGGQILFITKGGLPPATAPSTHASTHAVGGSDPLSTAAPTTNLTATGSNSVGSASTFSRSDHSHAISSSTAPTAITVGGSAVTGTSSHLARADHVHALPAFGTSSSTFCVGNDSRLSNSRAPTAHATTHQNGGADEITVDGLNGVLVQAQPVGVWQNGTFAGTRPNVNFVSGGLAAFTAADNSGSNRVDVTCTVATGSPVGLVVGGANVQGSVLGFARGDHQHALPAFGTASNTFCQGNDARLLRGSIVARVYLNTAQSLNTSGYQKVPLDAVSYDPSSIWLSGSKEFRPTVAGYYQVNIRIGCTANGPFACAIGRNSTASIAVGVEGANAKAVGGGGLVFCNGTTDTIQAFVACVVTTPLSPSSNDTYMDISGPWG